MPREDEDYDLHSRSSTSRRSVYHKCILAQKKARHAADREAILAERRRVRALDPEKARRQVREWNAQNPDKAKKSDWVKRLKRYGITIEDWDRMFIEQGGRCAVCKETVDRLCVDHDHKTGRVRGLLCLTCNFAAGALKDSVLLAESLIQYLKKHS